VRRARLLATLAAALLVVRLAATPEASVQAPGAPSASGLTEMSKTRLLRAGGALPDDHAVAVTYEGLLEVESHLEVPHAILRYHSVRRIVAASPLRARLDWTTWRDDDTTHWVETTILDGDRVLQREGPKAPFVELRGQDALDTAVPVWSAVPAFTCARMLARADDHLQGGPVSEVESRYEWDDALGHATYRLGPLDDPISLAIVRDDPRLGTVSQSFHYFSITTRDGDAWPDSLYSEGYPKGLIWHLHEWRTALEDTVPLAQLALPDSIMPSPPQVTDTSARVVSLGHHLWTVELRDADTRSLVAEFGNHLMVMETSSDVAHGERIRRAIRDSISTKPIRYVAFGHHHPDYIGGLRAFLADSATVVCAAANAAYVREIAHQYFHLTRDRFAVRWPGGMDVPIDTLVDGRWKDADATNEVDAIDIGALSHHTLHYIVFWLPRQKLLFEGDLGFFSVGKTIVAASRAVGLVQALEQDKIVPMTVLQGWPVNDNPAGLPYPKFRQLVAQREQH